MCQAFKANFKAVEKAVAAARPKIKAVQEETEIKATAKEMAADDKL